MSVIKVTSNVASLGRRDRGGRCNSRQRRALDRHRFETSGRVGRDIDPTGTPEPTGAVGADTQAAISKFEHARKLPVTGQMSDRLVRELTAMIGHPID